MLAGTQGAQTADQDRNPRMPALNPVITIEDPGFDGPGGTPVTGSGGHTGQEASRNSQV